MYDKFLKYLKNENLFSRTDKLLIGVSGGVDSVVLTALVDKLGNEFALAHCNFNLRGEESDEDEKFVEQLAADLGVKCFFSSFQTKDYAAERGISIEMAARDLRYEWFEQLRIAKNFHWILVGHHLDDVLETFLLNLSRGTGIRGLSGIKPKAGKIVRPLLFATREQIEFFAAENKLLSRHDASNEDTVYKRNKVRHAILPLFQELNPSFKRNLQNTIHYLHETELVFLQRIQKIRNSIVHKKDDWIRISIEELMKLDPLQIYLFELLRPYHFNSEVVDQIIDALEGNPGTRFFSSSHRLVIDRDEMIVTALERQKKELFYLDKNQKFVDEPIRMRISVERYGDDYRIPNSKDVAVFDYDKIRFPLVLRKWQKGEYFKPLGMDNFKKLSDFFIDEKFSIPEKEEAWIMASENKVVWIVGTRIDDRFKLTNSTKLVLRIERLSIENE